MLIGDLTYNPIGALYYFPIQKLLKVAVWPQDKAWTIVHCYSCLGTNWGDSNLRPFLENHPFLELLDHEGFRNDFHTHVYRFLTSRTNYLNYTDLF